MALDAGFRHPRYKTRRESESMFALPSIEAKLGECAGTMECAHGTLLLRAAFCVSQVRYHPPEAQRRERMDTPGNVRSRLRFDRLDHSTTPDGSGRVSVRLEWGGQIYEVTVPCLETQQGVIKAASQATVGATLASRSANGNGDGAGSGHRLALEVVGVKAVKVFDGWVVVTRLNGTRGDEKMRLLGAAPCEGEEDLPNAAVKAVLNASNRVMEQPLAP